MTKKISAIAAEIYDILEPLGADDRKRVVQAALTLLGEPAAPIAKSGASGSGGDDNSEGANVPPKAKIWMKQNALTAEQLDNVFHFGSDGVEVIMSTMPGKTNNEKCREAYLLVGTAQLLATGEPNFTDETARALCTKAGSYDSTNHGKFLQKMGNEFAGTKAKGWTLTGPGLKGAANLIKTIVNPAQ